MNWVNRKLKQIKKKCVKWLKKWCDTVSEKAMIQNSIFYKDYCLSISENMIIELLWLTHNKPLSGHQGQDWTRNQIKFYYYWFTLYYDVDCYIFNCIMCKYVKTFWQRPAGLLHFLEISQKCWQNLFCNFITDLSELKDINVIFTVVDKFLKKQHYILCYIKDKWILSRKTV